MFHVVLILFPILMLVIEGSLLLMGFTSVIVSIVGGTTAVLKLKNQTAKNLLLIGFSLLLLVGVLALLPFAGFLAELSINAVQIIRRCLLGLMIILSVGGIKMSQVIANKTGRRLLSILFGCVGVITGLILLWLLF